MRGRRFLLLSLLVLAALDVAGCARRTTGNYYVVDPATGQMTPVATQYAQQPAYAQAQASADPYGQRVAMQPAYVQPQQAYVQPQQAYAQASPQPSAQDDANRGLFSGRRSTSYVVAQPAAQQPYVIQYGGSATRPYAAPGYGYAYASTNPAVAPSYTLDSGDRLRIVVFGQEGLTNAYIVDAGGNVNLPLIGTVAARGTTPQQLSKLIAERLKQGYVREPHVTVEVETYRPFFILGEVTTPGQYAYVPNMTAEKAIAIAGGFSARANKNKVELTRSGGGQQIHGDVPLNYPLRPGDTVVVKERWF
jgi:polysaccharide export outer membrane protein